MTGPSPLLCRAARAAAKKISTLVADADEGLSRPTAMIVHADGSIGLVLPPRSFWRWVEQLHPCTKLVTAQVGATELAGYAEGMFPGSTYQWALRTPTALQQTADGDDSDDAGPDDALGEPAAGDELSPEERLRVQRWVDEQPCGSDVHEMLSLLGYKIVRADVEETSMSMALSPPTMPLTVQQPPLPALPAGAVPPPHHTRTRSFELTSAGPIEG